MSNDVSQQTAPEGALPMPRRSRMKAFMLGTVLLLSGVVIGSGLTLIGLNRRAQEFRQRPDMFSNRILSKMETDLELTKEQKSELSKIFKAAREDLDDVRRQHRVQAQAFFRDFHDQVAQVLTVKQQGQWEEWWKRARERAFQERGGPGGPSGQAGPGGQGGKPKPENQKEGGKPEKAPPPPNDQAPPPPPEQ